MSDPHYTQSNHTHQTMHY
uniref:Uncharacterized protein n=1 Tax=Arundo donax TaxID=35708 RepID=A0A0A9A4Y6_ARUDO